MYLLNIIYNNICIHDNNNYENTSFILFNVSSVSASKQ